MMIVAAMILGMVSYAAGSEIGDAFEDVLTSQWYSESIDWAVTEGIVSGTGNGKFSPDSVCSRAQIVTFLWRMAGEPKPLEASAEKFSDLQPGAYYHDAMVWASEAGILSGTSATTLSPDAACSRAQAVTILWRFSGAEDNYTSYFMDVPEDSYYDPAVAWACSRYVTQGTSLLEFSPHKPCTRAEIITMLYRMQRKGTEALQSDTIQAVRINNRLSGETRSLTADEISRFIDIFSRAALNENPEPTMGQGQEADPRYIVQIEYSENREDIFYSVETGARILYKYTGTFGSGGAGYIAVRSEELQQFVDNLRI